MVESLMDKNVYKAELERRLQAIFLAYQQGKDVPPAQLFRTEGYMEAACTLGLFDQQQLKGMMSETWSRVFGTPLPPDPFPLDPLPSSSEGGFQIPSAMRRAPVFPSK